MLWALQNGATGCISGLGNVMPRVLAGVVSAFNAGDLAEAERQQASSAPSARTSTASATPALVKRALYLMDPSVGASHQPALLPDPAQDAQIAEILRKHDL